VTGGARVFKCWSFKKVRLGPSSHFAKPFWWLWHLGGRAHHGCQMFLTPPHHDSWKTVWTIEESRAAGIHRRFRKLGLWQPPKCRSGNTHCDFLRIKYWSCHMRSLSQQFPTSKLNKHGPSKTSICVHLVVFNIGRNLDPKSRFHFGQSSEGGLEPVFRSKKFQGCREKDTPKLETNGMSSCRTMCSWMAAQWWSVCRYEIGWAQIPMLLSNEVYPLVI